MNCDQVFDVLTRGPFPTGTDCDVPVEVHLAGCAGCRRLAEALRPAIELFQESVDPEESRELPGYWCPADYERQTTVSYAARVESLPAARLAPGEARVGSWSSVVAWRMAAMLVVGVTLGTLAGAGWVLDGAAWPGFGAGASVAPLAPLQEAPRLTAAERMGLAVLPAACYRQREGRAVHDSSGGERLLTGANLENVQCCSGCHHAGAADVPEAATVRVAQSCQLCHAATP
jgi:hypothetical protein